MAIQHLQLNRSARPAIKLYAAFFFYLSMQGHSKLLERGIIIKDEALFSILAYHVVIITMAVPLLNNNRNYYDMIGQDGEKRVVL
jgi:hypothetical protein